MNRHCYTYMYIHQGHHPASLPPPPFQHTQYMERVKLFDSTYLEITYIAILFASTQ